MARLVPKTPAAIAVASISVMIAALVIGGTIGRAVGLESLRLHGLSGIVIFFVCGVVLNWVLVGSAVIATASGVLFGWIGAPVAILIIATAAVCEMSITRRLFPEYRPPQEWAPALRLLERRGVRAVVVMRLLPGIPHVVFNYALGPTRLPRVSLFLGTIIGGAPRIVAFCLIGAGITGHWTTSISGLVAVGCVGAFGLWLGAHTWAQEIKPSRASEPADVAE